MRSKLRSLLGLFAVLWPGPAAAATEFSSDKQAEAELFAVNNALSALYHEIGHLLIDQFELPILTREEDAADAIATLLLLEQGTDASTVVAFDAVDGYFMSAQLYGEALPEGADFSNQHGLDTQRAYQMACLLVGGDPANFEGLAEDVALPPERMESCAAEYAMASRSWAKMTEGHRRGAAPTGPPVAIIYEAAASDMAPIARVLQQHRVLEQVAATVTGQFLLSPPATLRALSCGEENAYYDIGTGEVTFCYEYAKFYYDLLIDPAAAGQIWAEDEVP